MVKAPVPWSLRWSLAVLCTLAGTGRADAAAAQRPAQQAGSDPYGPHIAQVVTTARKAPGSYEKRQMSKLSWNSTGHVSGFVVRLDNTVEEDLYRHFSQSQNPKLQVKQHLQQDSAYRPARKVPPRRVPLFRIASTCSCRMQGQISCVSARGWVQKCVRSPGWGRLRLAST